MACTRAQLVVLMDYLLGRIRDARKRNDWDEALRVVEEVRERIYYYGLEELQKGARTLGYYRIPLGLSLP